MKRTLHLNLSIALRSAEIYGVRLMPAKHSRMFPCRVWLAKTTPSIGLCQIKPTIGKAIDL